MKRRCVGLVAVMASFALMALGSGSSDGSSQKEITTSSTSAAVTSSGAGTADEATTDAGAAASAVASTAGSDQAHADASASITIEEQALYDADGIRITATEYVTDSIWGDGIKLLIENDTAESVGVGCSALIVNDYMITDLFSATVAAGKKSYETLYLSNSSLKAAGIENVGQVEVYFHLFNPDTYMTTKEIDCVTIKTSVYAEMDTTPNDTGYELYNAGGVRIVGKYVDEDSIWGAAVLVYIENNCGQNIIVQCDDMSINGFMVTPYFSADVYDGKRSIEDITLLSSELEENNITSIDEVELNFKILDEHFGTIAQSGAVSFSAR